MSFIGLKNKRDDIEKSYQYHAKKHPIYNKSSYSLSSTLISLHLSLTWLLDIILFQNKQFLQITCRQKITYFSCEDFVL